MRPNMKLVQQAGGERLEVSPKNGHRGFSAHDFTGSPVEGPQDADPGSPVSRLLFCPV